MDVLPVLLRCPLFAGIPADQLESLLPHARTRGFARGTFLFREGDPSGPLFIILRGLVSIARSARGRDQSVLALLGPDDVIGDMALFEDAPMRSADALALEPTDCIALPRSVVRELLEAHPEAMSRLVSRLAGKVRKKDRAFTDMASLDVAGRLAAKLLELAETYGERTADGTRITQKLSQRTLAGMIGCSRENVNRAIASFSDQGAISQQEGVITIVSAAALRRRS